jgi:nicotinamide-nucleotide amidase
MRSRWRHLDEDAVRAGNRKQALVPEGATILEPVGTAPGLIVPPAVGGPLVLVLPGPPGELRPMWETAVETEPLRGLLARAGVLEQRIMRLFGVPESEIALSLRALGEAGVELDGLEITTCLRRGEIEVATRYEASAEPAYASFVDFMAERHRDQLFSRDGSTVDEQVASLLVSSGRTVAVAESCTGGLMSARLTERGGSSEFFLGGAVVYSNEAKASLAGVDPDLILRYGAVSNEVAEALADGAALGFGADFGIGITGIAGPGGATPGKPVGLVYVAVDSDAHSAVRKCQWPYDREGNRLASVGVALDLLEDAIA